MPDWYEQKRKLKKDIWFKSLPSQIAQNVLQRVEEGFKSYILQLGRIKMKKILSIVTIVLLISILLSISGCCMNEKNENKFDVVENFVGVDGIEVFKIRRKIDTIKQIKELNPNLNTEIIERYGQLIIKNSNKNIFDIETKKYTNNKLLMIKQFEGTIFELNDLFKIEIIRLHFDGEHIIVYYFSENQIIIMTFDNNGNYEKNTGEIGVYDKTIDWIKNIKIGETTRYDIMTNYDRTGEYFMECGYIPPQSIHFTSDGYYVLINYAENKDVDLSQYVVESIMIFEF